MHTGDEGASDETSRYWKDSMIARSSLFKNIVLYTSLVVVVVTWISCVRYRVQVLITQAYGFRLTVAAVFRFAARALAASKDMRAILRGSLLLPRLADDPVLTSADASPDCLAASAAASFALIWTMKNTNVQMKKLFELSFTP